MRALSRLVVVVVVLAVVAAIADTAARMVAQNRLAAQIQSSQRLSSAPEVSIAGFPFLTQAVDGVYRQIDVRTGAVNESSAVSVSSVTARFSGVHVPLSAVLQGSVGSVPVDRVDGDVVVTYASVQQAIEANSDGTLKDVRITTTGAGKVQVSGTAVVGPVTLPFSAPLAVTLEGNTVTLKVDPSGLGGLAAAVREALAGSGALTVTVRLPALPYGLKIDGVKTGPDGVSVAAHATKVLLTTR